MTHKQDVRRYVDMGTEQICPINNLRESDDGNYVLYEDYKALQAENVRLRAKLVATENRSMAWLANALEQYANGDVITVPAGAGTEEEFFAWLKDQGSAGTVPEDISALIEKVRKWGVEHTGNEPSVSCFHRALDDLQAAIANPVPVDKPERISEQDVREILESYWDSTDDCGDWLKGEDGQSLLNRLNADREQVTAVAVPDVDLEQHQKDQYEIIINQPWVKNDFDRYAVKLALKVNSYGIGLVDIYPAVVFANRIREMLAAAPPHSQQSAESSFFCSGCGETDESKRCLGCRHAG